MSRRSKLILLAICLAGWADVLWAQGGDLEVYSMPSQNGTTARRVFKGANGQPERIIYYRGTLSGKNEDDLRVSQDTIFHYDDHGREIREEVSTPDPAQRHTFETSYDEGGYKQVRKSRDADGIVRYETRSYWDGKSTSLYFDDTGEKLVGLNGDVPWDIDLAAGWGEAVEGLICGIGFKRTQGKLADIRFNLTLRNVSAEKVRTVSSLPYEEFAVELRDRAGRLVARDDDLIRRRDAELLRVHHGPNEAQQIIFPYRSEMFGGGGYDLKDWYNHLPAGDYTMIVRWRGIGKDFKLASRPVTLHLVADE